jgi:glycosyltransferase involved in cell wall biosynthesis
LKNVLLITYYFPPATGIGGVRPNGIAKYLSSFGWNPVILTPNLPGDPDPAFNVIQTSNYDVLEEWKKRFGLDPKKSLNEQFRVERKKNNPSVIDLLKAIPNEILTYPDDKKGWYEFAIMEGERILQEQHIDAILSTSPPATCNLVAGYLAVKYHIPWIADFRDLWSQNHYTSYSPVWRHFEKELERKTLNRASAITTVSQPLAEKLTLMHEKKKIFVIKNGFDPDLINPGNDVDPLFKITHTGNLYEGKRDPAHLFSTLKELIDDGSLRKEDIRIEFFGYPRYGFPENWLQEEIERNRLQGIVTLHGQVSHEVAIAEQRKAQVLLLLTWDNPEERGVYTGKLFEYLAARRPILSLGYNEGGIIHDLLVQTKTGVHTMNDVDLKTVILQAYHEYISLGEVRYNGIDTEIMKYSHKEMARAFAEVMDQMIS